MGSAPHLYYIAYNHVCSGYIDIDIDIDIDINIDVDVDADVDVDTDTYIDIDIDIDIKGVPGRMCQNSGGCSLC